MANNYFKMMEYISNADWTPEQKAQAKQMIHARGIGPSLPAVPVPGLNAETPDNFVTSPNGLIRTGLSNAADGLAQMTRPGYDAKLGGTAKVIKGVGTAALPAALPFALANPVGAAYGLAGGLAGDKAATMAAQGLELPEGATELAGVAGGAAGGGLASKYGPAAVRGVTKVLGNGVAELLGKSTGVGGAGVRAAFEPHGPEFTAAMRGNISDEGLVTRLRDATDQLKDNMSQAYRADLAKIAGINQPLNAKPVLDKSLQTQMDKFNVRFDANGELDFSRSTIHSPSAQGQVRGIVNDIASWGSEPGDHTPLGLDTLKRRIGDFYSESSQARAFVQGMKRPVVDLLDTVPGYKDMTSKYAASSQLLSDVGRELSSNNPNPGTVVRKLQYITNQANNYRPALLDKLDAAAGSDVKDAAVGWGFRNLMPRGLAGVATPFAMGATALSHPGALPLGLLASPRVVGEGAAALGSAYRGVAGALPANSNPWGAGLLGDLLSYGNTQPASTDR